MFSGVSAYAVIRGNNLSGGLYETCLWPDAVLLRSRDGAASFYPGDDHNTDFYHWLPDTRVSSVLLLNRSCTQ